MNAHQEIQADQEYCQNMIYFMDALIHELPYKPDNYDLIAQCHEVKRAHLEMIQDYQQKLSRKPKKRNKFSY